MNKIKIIVVISIVLLAFTAHGEEYYIDGSSGNDNNAGTIDSPWETIGQANTTLIAGDTVYIRAGTYTISGAAIGPINSGTAGSPITYSAYPDEIVNLVGTSKYSIGIDLNGRDYIHVTGVSRHNMKFTGFGCNFRAGYSELAYAGNYNEIDHCEFGAFYDYPSTTAGVYYRGSTLQHGSQYNHIHDNYFHDWQWFTTSSDGPVLLEIGEENGTDATRYNVIEDNIFSHAGHHCVGLQGMYNVFRNNTVHNEDYWTGPAIKTYSPNETTYGERTIYGYRVMQLGSGMSGYVGNSLVEGNRIGPSGISMLSWYSDGRDGRGTQRGGTAFYLNSSNNIVRYNDVFEPVGKGIYFRRYSGGEVKYNHVYNNTIYHSGYSIENDINCDERFPVVLDYVANYIEYNIVKNHLFHSNWPQTTDEPSTSPYGGNNCGDRPLTSLIYGTLTTMTVANNLEATGAAATHFVDPDIPGTYSLFKPNLSLVSGSNAIDGAGHLTTVHNNDTGSGTTLFVEDASYFQDGRFGVDSGCDPTKWPSDVDIKADCIAVGAVGNTAQIVEIDYDNTPPKITLDRSISRNGGDYVWLKANSRGEVVLEGTAPDYGAHEYEDGDDEQPLVILPPQNLRIVN